MGSVKGNKIIVLQNSLRYLRFQCIWPKNEKEFDNRKVFYARFILLTLTTTILLWGTLAHMIMALRGITGGKIESDISFTIAMVGAYYFNFSYAVNVKKVRRALRKLSDLEIFGKPPGFDDTNKKLNKYAKWHQIYICIDMIVLGIPQLIDLKNCMAKNIEQGLNEVCGLVANVWFPIDIDYFPVKQIIFLIQLYSAYFSYAAASTVSFSVVESTEHLIFRISHLKDMFLEALQEKDVALRRPLLRRSIDYHNYVIRLAENLSDAYSSCVFVHVLFTGAILGSSGYQLLQEIQLQTIAFFLGWYFSLLMVAFVGQKLTDRGILLRDVIYGTKWYDLEVSTQRDINMILARCTQPIYIRAGPFGVMCYPVVLSIMKTSYSILSVLKGTS